MVRTKYDQFLLESLLLESLKEMKFVLSLRLRKILGKMNSVIADELLKCHRDLDFNARQTFIDVDEISDDSFTFIQANKASELLGIEDEKSYDSTVAAKLRDNTKISNEVYKKHRGSMKIGRIVNTIFPNKFATSERYIPGQKSRDVENFVHSYKSLFNQSDKFALFDIVKGDDIKYWYSYRHYASTNGSLGGSCMSHVNYFSIYTENPDTVEMVILYGDNTKTTIRGRAILWHLMEPEGRIYMERVYINDYTDEKLFLDFAHKNGWLYKGRQTYGGNYGILDPQTDTISNITMNVKVHEGEYESYPYMDTMIYLNPKKGILSSNSHGMKFSLSSTGGYADEVYNNDDDTEVMSKYHHGNIYERDAKWCAIGEDWVYANEAVRVFNAGDKYGEGHVFAVPGHPDVVHTLIEGSINKHFLKKRCVWSAYLNTWLFKWSVREVFLDKEKTKSVLDHKIREDKTFGKVGDEYYDINLLEKIGEYKDEKAKNSKIKTHGLYKFKD